MHPPKSASTREARTWLLTPCVQQLTLFRGKGKGGDSRICILFLVRLSLQKEDFGLEPLKPGSKITYLKNLPLNPFFQHVLDGDELG